MKRAAALLLAAGLILSLAACKKEPEPTITPTRPSELITENSAQEEQSALAQELATFWLQQPEMKPEEAQAIITKEEADVTAEEYRQAVYTVNKDKASQIVKEATDTQSQTSAVKELFEGIAFRFIEGDTFGSMEVAKQVSKKGTYALNTADGYYWFTFHDRTLAQAAATMKNENSLEEYIFVLEWLLADPNVEVKALLD